MKRFILVLFVLLFFSAIEYAQVREFESYRNSLPKISTHDKAALWPAQSFYQRKSEWQWIVDSTWGPGVSTSQKLNIFDTYANLIQTKFALFSRLNLDWDSLKTFWRSKITDGTSNGGLHQIMSHLAWSLKDGHSVSWNIDISHLPLNPGTPLFVIVSYAAWDVSHFGACLTVSSDGEIFVFKAIDNHPLGLEPGDIILGYEGVKWMDIVEELMDFHIPIFGASSTNEEARNHDLLMSAGMNWHMFSTIDIVKYSTGDTLHLSLEPLLQLTGENLTYAEQMDIPGVPKPDYGQGEQGSYGIIDNQNIGYIYIYDHMNIPGLQTIEEIFLEAVQNLYNTNGLIIDLRSDPGGPVFLEDGFDLLLNKKITELKYAIRCNGTDLYSLCETNSPWWNTNFIPNPQTFFQKPIAILVGPKCMSMGDFTAYRFKSFPNGRFFGKTTATAVGGATGYYDDPGLPGGYNGWVFYTQIADTYLPDHPYQYLSGVEFPVDKKIWLTKEDVVNNFDTVVEEAVSWINNLSYCYNAAINKSYTQDNIEITADVKNPNNHTLSIIADILNNDVVVDSINCVIVGNKISETWSTPANSENFYSVTIKTQDIEDTTVHTLPNIVRFTTAGPLVVDSILFVHLPAMKRYSTKPSILNLGNSLPITGVSMKIKCEDPWIVDFPGVTVNFPTIQPGATAISNSVVALIYDSTTFPGYFNLKFEIMRNGWTYWYDSKQVVVEVEDEIILSSFDLDSEGWSVNGGNIYYQNSNGNPGGFIEFDDNQDGAGIFIAPSKFLGDLTLYDQGKLKFDLKNTYDNGQDSLYGYGNVRISSSNSYADKNVVPLGYISEWTSFSIPMTADDWGVTESGWDSLLADVIEISIQMDAQWNYYDRVGLDNFALSPNSTDVEQGIFNVIAASYQLNQNYPNPFNLSTKIGYSITQSGLVTLKVYDVLGTEIETLVNEEKPVGTYELNWNAANLPSGVYFYRLQAGDFVQTRKMILLK